MATVREWIESWKHDEKISNVTVSLSAVAQMKKEYELIIGDLRKQLEDVSRERDAHENNAKWYHEQWKKEQDVYRKKLILTMMQSGKYTYNDVVFYADEIIKELDRTSNED